jgi:PAT family beta-lactamase induction signal transducer AmpG
LTPPEGAAPAPEPTPTFWARLRAAPWVVSTYFAEGLPFAIVRQLSGEFLTSMGVSAKEIGATSLYGLAWNLKLFWSPLVDRYGTIRRWLIAAEALLGLLVLALAWPAGRGDTGLVWRAVVVVAFVAATHDIAVDGFYLEALDKGTQARFSGLRVAAYRVALLAGKGLLILAGLLQAAGMDRGAAWRITFAAAGAALLLLAGGHALALPPAAPARAAGTPAPRYHEAFASLLKQPRIGWSLAFIIAYKAGDALLFAQNAPFLKSLGFGDLMRGTVGTVATVVSISGSIAGGALIGRHGLRRMLGPIALVQSLAILAYVGLAAARPGAAATAVVAVFEQLAGGVGDAALAVFLLRRCSAEHKAAHFAIVSALMSVASTAAGVSSGYLLEHLAYPAFFGVAFVASLPGVALTWFVPKD